MKTKSLLTYLVSTILGLYALSLVVWMVHGFFSRWPTSQALLFSLLLFCNLVLFATVGYFFGLGLEWIVEQSRRRSADSSPDS